MKKTLILFFLVVFGQNYLIPRPLPPINLLYFDATQQGDSVFTEWATADEVNNDYFTVERSTDGINFILVDTVSGAGSSDTTITYFLIDSGPFTDSTIYYYRLKQTDYNGNYEYFNLEAVQFIPTGIFEISFKNQNNSVTIAPNPLTNHGKIKFNNEKHDQVQFDLFDLNGKKVKTLDTSGNEIEFSKGDLEAGIFFFMLTNTKNKIRQMGKILIE